MQVRQFNELEAARRAYTFLTSTPPAASLANMPASFTQQVQALGQLITQIDAEASAQTAANGAITDKVAAASEAAKELRSGHLLPIKQAAKILVHGSTGGALSPNFADSITVPDARSHSALAASNAAVQLVTPYNDLFVARGLPSDFLTQLSTQATTLTQTMQASGVAKTTRVSTTTTLKQLLQELRSTMAVLEISVAKACKADRVNGPTTMTGWRNAKTIRKTSTPTDIPFAPPALIPAPTPAAIPATTSNTQGAPNA